MSVQRGVKDPAEAERLAMWLCLIAALHKMEAILIVSNPLQLAAAHQQAC